MTHPTRALRLALAAALLLTTAACGKGKNPFEALAPEQTLSIESLEGPVEVLRDAEGVPHIYCTTDLDCIRAQGYVQAHDRLFEMDLFRNYGEGSLGRLFGTIDLVRDADRTLRQRMAMRDGSGSVIDAIVANLDDETRDYVQAYTDGVNAYIEAMIRSAPGTHFPDEYGFTFVLDGAEFPRPWEVRDTVAIGRLFSYFLADTLGAEQQGANLAAKTSGAFMTDFIPSRPMDPTFVVPGFYDGQALGREWAPSPELMDRMKALSGITSPLAARTEELRPWLEPLGKRPGSNNWAVDAAHSATGNALVANDPHLSLWAPPVWHESHLDSVSLPGAKGNIRGRGVSFPGTPGIVIGHTEHLAWAVTVVGYDVTDMYDETIVGVDQVEFNGAPVDVIKVTVEYPRGPNEEDGVDVEKLCVVPHHGPIIAQEGVKSSDLADPSKPCLDPSKGTKAISLRWTGMDPSNELRAFRGVVQATSVDEALDAWKHFQVGAQNFVVADTTGEIAYFPRADVPVRDGDLNANPPWLPLPGTGGYEWTGYVPDAELPQVRAPQNGYVVTANNDIAGVSEDGNPLNDKHYLFYAMDLGPRAGRITRRLEDALDGDGVVDMDEMQDIQTDTVSDFAAAFVPYILAAADAEPALATSLGVDSMVTALRSWKFDMPTGLASSDPDGAASTDATAKSEAIASSIFGAWLFAFGDKTFKDELVDAGFIAQGQTMPFGQFQHKALYHLLADGNDIYWDDVSTAGAVETRDEIILGALAVAKTDLENRLGTDQSDWLWGRIHNVVYQSAFGMFGLPNQFDIGPVANQGGMHAINVANYNRGYVQHSGPSVRMITDLGKGGEVDSRQRIPGGIIDILENINRDDQIEPWLKGEYRTIAWEAEDVFDAASARDGDAKLAPGGRWVFEGP